MYGYNEDDIIDDIIEQEIAGIESGRRRGGRRFGRALAAIGTLGMSEAALRRGARNGRHEERASMQRAAAPQNLTPNAAQAAMAAVQLQQQAQLGFRPSGGLAGYFGITEVSVPALGSASSASTAQEPTQLHRLILDAIDPTASITPQVAEAYLRVSNIRLGSQSMFNNNVPMTLGALKSNATLSGVMSRVIMPGQQLSIDYLNRHPTLAILVGGAALGPNS
ncbi:MAG TPA: hypothetical protein PLP66_03885 [Phycisphaerae bacterium]|nr:hypothetical protein [Phycisphaerae bacterium]